MASSSEWRDDFERATFQSCGSSSAISGTACWDTYRKDGKGSYTVFDGSLLIGFGPCPSLGRSLYVSPHAVLEGDVFIETQAQLPEVGKLIVFAHGDNLTSGYRGVLYPSALLELLRIARSEWNVFK